MNTLSFACFEVGFLTTLHYPHPPLLVLLVLKIMFQNARLGSALSFACFEVAQEESVTRSEFILLVLLVLKADPLQRREQLTVIGS